jgi:NAD(P)-dependent dehydrogenase (short-subunit alcohol dehydrogenase family)
MKIALDNQKVVITGARGVISAAFTKRLTDNGASIRPESARIGTDILIYVSRGAESGPVADAEAVGDTEWRDCAALARAGVPARRTILVLSAAALVPVRGAAQFSAQQASLAVLVRTLAMEFAPSAVVNALAVGAITGGSQGAHCFTSHSPLRRGASLAEISAALLFLTDPDNTYTTGHVMAVDGGWSAGYARDF